MTEDPKSCFSRCHARTYLSMTFSHGYCIFSVMEGMLCHFWRAYQGSIKQQTEVFWFNYLVATYRYVRFSPFDLFNLTFIFVLALWTSDYWLYLHVFQNWTSDVPILREPCTSTYLCSVESWRRQVSVHSGFFSFKTAFETCRCYCPWGICIARFL